MPISTKIRLKAITPFSKAVEICTRDASAYPQWHARLLLAEAYLSTGKKAAAAYDLKNVMELVPRDKATNVKSVLEAIDGLIEAYADAKQYPEAIKWAEEAANFAPDSATKESYRTRVTDLKNKESAAGQKKPLPTAPPSAADKVGT